MPKPSVFIGCSTEGREIARRLQHDMHDVVECKVWDQGVFTLGSGTADTLVEATGRFDFAILVFTGDDSVESRGTSLLAPRDNVVLELGLFMGRLGPTRAFVLTDSRFDLKIPTDLSGVTLATYDRDWFARDPASAIAVACVPIRDAMRAAGSAAALDSPPQPAPSASAANPLSEPAQMREEISGVPPFPRFPVGEREPTVVLLVEDNADDERLFVRTFEESGVRATLHVCRSGREAVSWIEGRGGDKEPLVVVLDLTLKKVGGMAVLRAVRDSEAGRDASVVVFTSSDFHHDVSEAYTAGANSYVRKPIDYSDYKDTLIQLLRFWTASNISGEYARKAETKERAAEMDEE